MATELTLKYSSSGKVFWLQSNDVDFTAGDFSVHHVMPIPVDSMAFPVMETGVVRSVSFYFRSGDKVNFLCMETGMLDTGDTAVTKLKRDNEDEITIVGATDYERCEQAMNFIFDILNWGITF